MSLGADKPPGRTGVARYLSLLLGDEACAVPVHRVREIIRFPSLLGMTGPTAPVKGVINLRGQTIPVLDIRTRSNPAALPSSKSAEKKANRTCIVVLQVNKQQCHSDLVGLVVDSVEEVIDIASADITDPPDVAKHLAACQVGKARVQGVLKTLLDVDRIATHVRTHRRSLIPGFRSQSRGSATGRNSRPGGTH